MQIAILGAGAFGQALAKILRDNHHASTFYDPLLFPEISLDQACRRAEAVIIAIPTEAITSFLAIYPPKLKQLPTILASKGLFSLELFKEFPNFSIVSGPAFADEILAGHGATMTASSQFCAKLLHNQQIDIELSDDALGITICGALKNIYAIGAGYRAEAPDELAKYIQSAHQETKDYLTRHGAQAATAELSCGLGDLILTCTNRTSRNFRAGQLLRKGQSKRTILRKLQTVEGISAVTRADRKGYPLISEIYQLVNQK